MDGLVFHIELVACAPVDFISFRDDVYVKRVALTWASGETRDLSYGISSPENRCIFLLKTKNKNALHFR